MEAIVNREVIVNKVLCRGFAVIIFILLTALGAFVRIPLPFTPVPITLQTLFVLLSGALLGIGLGVTAQLSYIFLGIIGLPVFTGAASGLLYLFGPTGGYLVGFILANIFLARFIKYGNDNLFLILCILMAADLILLLSGTLWLKFTIGYAPGNLLLAGFFAFLPGDLFKAFIAAILYLKLKNRFREIL
jgi:biotin transport system substrate-specific component